MFSRHVCLHPRATTPRSVPANFTTNALEEWGENPTRHCVSVSLSVLNANWCGLYVSQQLLLKRNLFPTAIFGLRAKSPIQKARHLHYDATTLSNFR